MIETLRSGLKAVLRRPAVAIAVVLPLALATALSTSLFAVADGLLFRSPPFRDAERTIKVDFPKAGPRLSQLIAVLIDPARMADFTRGFKGSPLFSATVAGAPGGGFNTRVVQETDLQTVAVDPSFFSAFGLNPLHGRLFTEDDVAVSQALASADHGVLPVIVSHGYWTREFGANPQVIGRTTTLATRRVTIVGVMKPGVKFPGRTDVWTPRGRGPANQMRGFAQLAPGVTIERAREAFPFLDFTPLRDWMRPDGAGAVLFVFIATLALLLLAWVQIAGLVLANASDRLREIAIRLALGAHPRRIAGQFAGEAAWLGAGALVVAWLATPVFTRWLIGALPEELTAAQYFVLDWRAVSFSAAATLTGFTCLTVAAAIVAQRISPLSLVSRTAVHAPVSRRRTGILIVQTACTVFVLYLAGVAGYSYLNVLRFNYGFDADNVVFIDPPLGLDSSASGAEYTRALADQEGRIALMAEKLGRMAGVRIVTTVGDTPMPTRLPDFRGQVTHYDGRKLDPIVVRQIGAGDNVIEALGGTLVAGHGFDHPGARGRLDVVLISETLARQLSPVVPVIGSIIDGSYIKGEIIGVFRDIVDSSPERPAVPLVIQPAQLRSIGARILLVRTDRPAIEMMPRLRKVVEEEFGPMRPTQMRLLADDVGAARVPWQRRASVLGLVAALGLPLATVGLASGLLLFVKLKGRELGIRLALGATPQQARQVVIGYTRRVIAWGAVGGLIAGTLAGRLMAAYTFEVGTLSPLTSAGVVGVIGGLAWLSSYIPARRASRVDPAVVLRAE